MRIVYLLAASYARGGIKICIEHCNRLAALGHDVQILGRHPEPDWIEVHVPWTAMGSHLGSELPQCDIVVFSFYEQAYFTMQAALESGCVPVYFAQGDEVVFGDPAKAEERKDRDSILAAQASVRMPYPLITVSSAAAARIEALGGKDISVIPNGIDRSVFKPHTRENTVPRVFCVGAIRSLFKGIPDIFGALMKLRSEEMEFSLVRASAEPEEEVDLPLKEEFHHNPAQEMLARLYAGADIYVGASSNESFYLTPLEAMACGTAVICSDLPAVREYAAPDRDFLPFPPGDVPALARQLRRALRYPELRRCLADNGLDAAAKMDWDVIIPRYEELLRTLWQRREAVHENLLRELKNPTVHWQIENRELE